MNVTRQDELYLRAISDSIYTYKPTISLDICPEEHMASWDLELPERNSEIEYGFRLVAPRTKILEARKVFHAYILARTLIEYKDEINLGGSGVRTRFLSRTDLCPRLDCIWLG